MKPSLIAFILVFAGTTLAITPGPECSLLNIPVTVSRVLHKDISSPINYVTFDGTYGSFPNSATSGNFNISALYCSSTSKRAKTDSSLQILVHGGTYNKTYWSGLKVPPESINGTTYSWIDYATSQGYNVLAIDRLCSGNSSHPDGANECQIQVQAATIHTLTQRARAGTLVPHSSKPFSSIIYVGHSFGSSIGAFYTNTYPNDTNATILTGYSLTTAAFYSFAASMQPARDFSPRFIDLPPTYVVYTDPRTLKGFFYNGSYNPIIPSIDLSGSSTITIGEALSLAALTGPGTTQPNIRTPILVMNGQHDELECPYTALDPLYASGGQCGDGDGSITSRTRVQFPNAAAFEYFNVPNTGHCINLHYSAPMAFAAAHKFLIAQGL